MSPEEDAVARARHEACLEIERVRHEAQAEVQRAALHAQEAQVSLPLLAPQPCLLEPGVPLADTRVNMGVLR